MVRSAVSIAITTFGLLAARGAGAAPSGAELEREFAATVRPFLATYCVDCHNKEKAKGQLDLGTYATFEAVVRGQRQWETVLEMVASGEMPPEKATQHPPAPLREQVAGWIRAVRAHEAQRNAGDPGPVLARRLSNTEYDYTIRDLTGVDIRPTREFPVDPANELGFDNSGESLAMSPALLKKHLQAARTVSEHLVLTPTGIAFAPHPVITETDRDRYAVQRIISFYERQPTDLSRYFLAAWRFQHRAAAGRASLTLAEAAAEEGVSRKYLATLTAALEAPEPFGPMSKLQSMWRALPPAPGSPPEAVRAACEEMRDFVVRLRERTAPQVKNLRLKAVGVGSQPFVLWRNTQEATQRNTFDPGVLHVQGDPALAAESRRLMDAVGAVGVLEVALQGAAAWNPSARAIAYQMGGIRARVTKHATPDPDLAVPPGAEARARYEAAFTRFARIFPDAFYVSERDRPYMDRPKERQLKGRLLGAGYHNMMGYFRDDPPLYQPVLDERGQRELDGLWRELDFVTLAPLRQHADFIFYERAEGPRTIKGPEFDFVRSEDRSSTSDAMIRRMAKLYVAKARESLRTDGGDALAIPVLEEFFRSISANIRRLERDLRTAQPSHLEGLVAFAQRAYRRPLTRPERASVVAFYRSLRARGGLTHEDALRDTLVSVLVSPHFLYRFDLVASGKGARPLPGHALASRLSYFLWSSMPDAELLARAAAGDLHRPEVLVAQARRMLRDPRARALAVEFGGNWLDFRRFEEHNSVDRERFPTFDDHLRRSMFEEPVRFLHDVLREDRSVLDLLYANHTFVNQALARHYGMPALQTTTPDEWVRIEDAHRQQRGGLLPMAVFLTRNAPGLRTSPVKRGYWVVRRVLGEHIPAPPAQVPDLPNDERSMGALTLREVLARHRQDKACAGCHARFDSFGLAFEGYGPVGEVRTRDLGGRPVDTRAAFPGGAEGVGLAGLRAHIRTHRQGDFLDNLSRKLLGYGLGRNLMLSDESIVRQMREKLAAEGNRFGALVEAVVTSPQFLTKRGRDDLAMR